MSFEDARSGKVVFVAHCVLNQNAVAPGLAVKPGALGEVVAALNELGFGIVQLPCPETLFAGLMRWWQTREQYESVGYRKFCKSLARSVADLAEEFERCGVRVVAVVGMKGSPSCSASEVSYGWRGGDPKRAGERKRAPGFGVFMQELRGELESRGITPLFLDVDRKRLAESVEKLRKTLARFTYASKA